MHPGRRNRYLYRGYEGQSRSLKQSRSGFGDNRDRESQFRKSIACDGALCDRIHPGFSNRIERTSVIPTAKQVNALAKDNPETKQNLASLSRCSASRLRRCRPERSGLFKSSWTAITAFRVTRRSSTGASLTSSGQSLRSRASSFSMENWSPWISEANLHFRFYNTVFAVGSDILLRLRLTQPKLRTACEFASFRRREALESLLVA